VRVQSHLYESGDFILLSLSEFSNVLIFSLFCCPTLHVCMRQIDMRGALFKRFRHGQGRERKVKYPTDSETETESDEEAAAAQVLRRKEKLAAKEAAPQRAGNVVVQYEGGFQFGCVDRILTLI